MQPAPDLLTPLNGIISSSESESKPSPGNWLACRLMYVSNV
ncbi:lysis system o-spanin lipoprotein Rz1 [Citrobacter farmeri]